MADIEEGSEAEFEDQGHQGCYVFTSLLRDDHDMDDRPKKKRKTTKTQSNVTDAWPKLCGGSEPPELVGVRQETFRSLWNVYESQIHDIVNKVDSTVSEELKAFIRSGKSRSNKLKTGLIVSGPDNQVQHDQFDSLVDTQEGKTMLIPLRASQSPNLQTALKNVIRHAIETDTSADAYITFLAANKALIPMNFDLELLQKYVEKKQIQNVVISISDADAYDLGVLAELLASLTAWTERIPFTVLVGIATTVSLFESRLSKSTIRLLDTTSFDFSSNEDKLYNIFCAVQCNPATQLFLNPATINTLSEILQDQSATTSSFVRTVKYTSMTHFFANPLSTLLSRRFPEKAATDALSESIRNTSSFQAHCSSLLKQGKFHAETIYQLLNNDAFLLTKAQAGVHDGIDYYRRLNERTEKIVRLYKHLHPNSGASLTLHARLLQSLSSPSTHSTDLQDTILSTLKLLPSDTFVTTIFAFPSLFEIATNSTLINLTTSISNLHTTHSTTSIKSTYSTTPNPSSNSIFTSTITPAPATPAENAYTTILDTITTSLHTYLTQPFTPPSVIAIEAFLFTNQTLLQRTFQPRPRYAIERALSKPPDYLGCDADCESCYNPNPNDTRTHNPSRPNKTTKEPTSIVFNLLNEAGRDVNVRDLWDRFSGIMHAGANATSIDNEPDDEADDAEAETYLSLFYTALAELRMLGMINPKNTAEYTKGTKGMVKGVDVISRETWSGL